MSTTIFHLAACTEYCCTIKLAILKTLRISMQSSFSPTSVENTLHNKPGVSTYTWTSTEIPIDCRKTTIVKLSCHSLSRNSTFVTMKLSDFYQLIASKASDTLASLPDSFFLIAITLSTMSNKQFPFT